MQSKRRSEILVGGFLVFGLVLFVVLLFLMGSMDFIFTDHATVEADFEDVQSLQEGDPVYVFGMKVGRVISIELLPATAEDPSLVRATFVVPTRFRERLRVDSKVKIDKTLTGTISVLIQEGAGRLLPEGQVLRGQPTADFSVVTEKANQVLAEGEQLVSAIRSIVESIESEGTLTTAIQDLAGLVKDLRAEIVPIRDRLRALLSEIQEIVDENRLDIRHSVANLKETTDRANAIAEKLQETPDLLNGSLAEIEKAGASVKDLLVENRSHIDTILQDLRHTATNSANLTAEVKRRPWRLLYRPSESEIQAMDLYDAAWAYNLGASELNRSVRDLADQWTRLDREGQDVEILREAEEEVRQSLKRYREAEDVFWEKLRATE